MSPWLFIGFGLGLLVGAIVAASLLHRHLRRERAAEVRARAAERMAEIGAMTGGLAHEIKNPLSTIGLNAQLLAEGIDELAVDTDAKSRLTNRVRALRREVDRLRGILTDFLEYAGQVRLDPRPTDLNALVGELIDFYRPEAERNGVRLHADLPAQPLIASLDAKLFKQALLNLLLNATQAMAALRKDSTPAGELILRVREAAEADKRKVAKVQVIDTGPGMTSEMLAKIFNPYFTTKSGGTGLGLPTARRLIEEHGGRIEVHSEPGKGSDFCVTVPRERPATGGTAS